MQICANPHVEKLSIVFPVNSSNKICIVGLWPTTKTEERLLFRPLIKLIAISTDPKYNSSKYVAFQ